MSVFSLYSFSFLSSAISYKLVLGIPCISVQFRINALELRETPSRLGLHNNALDLRETSSRLGLHNNALVCVKLRHDLVCITMPLVCVRLRHDLVCMNVLSLGYTNAS